MPDENQDPVFVRQLRQAWDGFLKQAGAEEPPRVPYPKWTQPGELPPKEGGRQ